MDGKELYEMFHSILNKIERYPYNKDLKNQFHFICKLVLAEAKSIDDALVYLAAAQVARWTSEGNISLSELKKYLLQFLNNLRVNDKEGIKWEKWALRILVEIYEAEYNFLEAARYKEELLGDYSIYDDKVLETYLKAGCDYALEYLQKIKSHPLYNTSKKFNSIINAKIEYVLDKKRKGYKYKPRNKKIVYKKLVIVLKLICEKLKHKG